MSWGDNCIACRFERDGVKTRKSLVHTCGKYSQYFVSVDCYNGIDNVCAIGVARKDVAGNIIWEYMGKTKSKEEFEKTLEWAKQYYNAVPLEENTKKKPHN